MFEENLKWRGKRTRSSPTERRDRNDAGQKEKSWGSKHTVRPQKTGHSYLKTRGGSKEGPTIESNKGRMSKEKRGVRWL